MSNELKILGGNGLAEMKEQLPIIKPTKWLSVRLFALRSLMNSEPMKKLLEACTEHLRECKDCDEIHEDGFGVKWMETKKKKYKSSARVKAAEKALKLAKAELALAQAEAGFTLVADKAYYKAI